ncbi:hypothetical protein O6H91_03G035800 [Diphasiastrum complanatum]|uniref:Uncharacterized protein n=3 Tax=Diphasiastrum complanatum TaxID=34168 RepID=A0ACC2E526_DIPCM|nr:hypothetical protein O6H91_03G035800 [Diphasiastrum complanatum]KAJ7561613.1 hypothetical protein O6H91_03G035800 [Diphasiastrum complanatum]KAJ7561618.1 hypothetical protein O6H91_03G035800 [Diphasiastrum complanatum]
MQRKLESFNLENFPKVSTPVRKGGLMDYSSGMNDKRQVSQTRVTNPKGAFSKSNEREGPSRHLWVGNVSSSISEAVLKQKFGKFGVLENVTLYPHRSYAFVNFKSQADAEIAKKSLQGAVVGGLALRIEFAKGAKPSRHLLVSGLCHSITQEQLEAEFKSFGILEDLKFFPNSNSACVDYIKLDDAISALNSLNQKQLGNERIQVDFGQSENSKRDEKFESRSSVHEADILRAYQVHLSMSELSRGYQESSRGSKRSSAGSWISQNVQADPGLAAPGGSQGKRDGEPSDVLWIGFPADARVDERDLHRAFIPYAEIERITTFPGRLYAFIQFRSVEEAVTAKNALSGKLFNDPRFRINFSNSEIGPVDKGYTNAILPFSQSNEVGFAEALSKGQGFSFPRTSLSNTDKLGSGPPMRPLNPSMSVSGGYGNTLGAGNVREGQGLGLGRGVGAGLNLRMLVGERMEPQFDRPPVVHSSSFPALSPKGHAGEQMGPDDGWDLPEEDFLPRDFKRARLEATVQGESSLHSGQSLDNNKQQYGFTDVAMIESISRNLPLNNARLLSSRGDVEICNSGAGLLRPPSGLLDRSRPLLGANSGAPVQPLGANLRDNAGGLSGNFPSERSLGVANEGWKWEGTIAKGGTFICRARCFPVDKGIDINLPEVINCTARTDLDMLGKHIFQAGDYGTVFFVPQGDVHVAPYQDFLHYLQEKHRAGVAKLGDGSSLFLVPPSDFSEKILKIPGNSCIFGVVLKFQQSSAGRLELQQSQTIQQLPETFLQLQTDQQFIPQPPLHPPVHAQLPPSHPVQPPVEQHAVQSHRQSERLGSTSQESEYQRFVPSFEGQSSLQTSVLSTIIAQLTTPQSANITLTPELIASLTAFLPHSQPSSGINLSTAAGHAQNLSAATYPVNAGAGDGMVRATEAAIVRSVLPVSSSGVAGSEVRPFNPPFFRGNPPLPPGWPPYSQEHQTNFQESQAPQTVEGLLSLSSNSVFRPQPFAHRQYVPLQRIDSSGGLASPPLAVIGQGHSFSSNQGSASSEISGQLQPTSFPFLTPSAVLPTDQITQLTRLLEQNKKQLLQIPQNTYEQHEKAPSMPPQPPNQQQIYKQISLETSHASQGQVQQQQQVPPQGTGLHRGDSVQQQALNAGQVQNVAIQSQGTEDQDVARMRFQATLHLAQALLQQMQQQDARAPGSTELR